MRKEMTVVDKRCPHIWRGYRVDMRGDDWRDKWTLESKSFQREMPTRTYYIWVTEFQNVSKYEVISYFRSQGEAQIQTGGMPENLPMEPLHFQASLLILEVTELQRLWS